MPLQYILTLPTIFSLLQSYAYALPLSELQPSSKKHQVINDDEFPFVLVFLISVGSLVIGIFVILVVLIAKIIINRRKAVKLENTIPGSIDDEFEIEERLQELSPNEQHLYRTGQEYIKMFPPINDPLSLSAHLIIQEKGIEAWEFIPDPNLPNDCVLINDRTELTFTNFDYQCSIQSNLPIPKINDVYYFESKIYSFESPEDSIISIGLSTKPYPYFRLPGRHLYSVGYDSNGSRRVNNSFKLTDAESSVFPALQQGDVVGVGYRVRSGTIFFTRNGKKLSEKSIGGHIKGMKMNNIFPIIGTNNPCVIHVNLGQAGYVFIEANIKKWGYAAKEGTRPPLPDYNYASHDLLLESSNEDDDEIINPPDFYESARYESANNSSSSLSDDITLDTLLPQEPPIYHEDNEEEEEDALALRNAENNQFVTSPTNILDEVLDESHNDQENLYEANGSNLPRDESPDSV